MKRNPRGGRKPEDGPERTIGPDVLEYAVEVSCRTVEVRLRSVATMPWERRARLKRRTSAPSDKFWIDSRSRSSRWHKAGPGARCNPSYIRNRRGRPCRRSAARGLDGRECMPRGASTRMNGGSCLKARFRRRQTYPGGDEEEDPPWISSDQLGVGPIKPLGAPREAGGHVT